MYPQQIPLPLSLSRTTTFGVNTLQALANADAANVLVAVHGAGATNAYAMHEGSALIEIRCEGHRVRGAVGLCL